MIRLIFATIIFTLLVQKPALAYLDPGTASIILQALVGGFAVAGIFFRRQIYRLFSLFRRAAGKASATDASAGDRVKNDPHHDD